MNKKKKTSRSFLWRAVLLLLVLLCLYLVFIYFFNRSSPLTHSEEATVSTPFIHEGEPVIQTISRWYEEDNLDRETINRRLPERFEVLVLNSDITANNAPNYVIITCDPDLPELSENLRDAGFTGTFRELVIYEVRNRKLYPVLTIDNDAIRDEHENRLIDQVPARSGYAMVLEPYENEQLYDQPVELLEIIMLDENGRIASDEIVIYWDTSESTYKATNTFGAP